MLPSLTELTLVVMDYSKGAPHLRDLLMVFRSRCNGERVLQMLGSPSIITGTAMA